MSNVSLNLTIDRNSTGNSRIQGRIGNEVHAINVWKGPQAGDAYVEGEQRGEPTTLRINTAFSSDGQAVFGRVAGVPFKGNWSQEPLEGDVKLSLNAATLTIDVNPQTGVTESVGTRVKSTTTVTDAAGDENVALLSDGHRVNFQVDRRANGDIQLHGQSSDGPFRLDMKRTGKDGDLRLSGTLPESLSLLPVMWELYGNDSVEPPAKPLTMGAAATLSSFWGCQLG